MAKKVIKVAVKGKPVSSNTKVKVSGTKGTAGIHMKIKPAVKK